MNELFTLGDTLRMAREHLKMSQGDVAEATRMKVHMVDAIERNDFSRIAVPLYGKGFIKLYAECVGLDPDPLIRDYLARYARAVRPSLHSEQQAPQPPPHAPLPAMPSAELARPSRRIDWGGLAEDVVQTLHEGLLRLALAAARARAALHGLVGARRGSRPYRTVSAGLSPARLLRGGAMVAAVLVVILLVYGIVRLVGRGPAEPETVAVAPVRVAAPLRLAAEPPPPYVKPRLP